MDTPAKGILVNAVGAASWKEFDQLKDMTSLEELLMVGNPLEEKHSAEGDWVEQVSARLPNLKKLDGIPIVR